MKKPFKGIIFDMDGLLFDTESLYCQANMKIAPKHGIKNYDEEYYRGLIGLSDEETAEIYYEDFAEVGKTAIDAFILEGHLEVKEMFLAGLAPIKPGVIEILTYLKAEKIPCIVASSNLRQFIDILLEKAEIRRYFIDIISGDDVAKAKPDPEIVHKALAKLELAPEECLMLEDSRNGILASYRAGVPVIMVPDMIAPTPEVAEMTLEILPSLHEVINYLK